MYLVDERGFGPSRAGSALALLLVGGLIGRPAWGWVSDRLHHERVRVLQIAGLLAAAFLALLPSTDGAALLPVLLGIGFCSVGWNGVFLAMLTEIVPPGLIGSTTGVALLLVHLGAVAVPPIVGLTVVFAGSWPLAWIACAAATLASVAILQVGRMSTMVQSMDEGRPHAI